MTDDKACKAGDAGGYFQTMVTPTNVVYAIVGTAVLCVGARSLRRCTRPRNPARILLGNIYRATHEDAYFVQVLFSKFWLTRICVVLLLLYCIHIIKSSSEIATTDHLPGNDDDMQMDQAYAEIIFCKIHLSCARPLDDVGNCVDSR